MIHQRFRCLLQLAKKQADLDKCSNYHAEILKAEQRIEEIRLERDEVRSTLSKVPTCVICLDKRVSRLFNVIANALSY